MIAAGASSTTGTSAGRSNSSSDSMPAAIAPTDDSAWPMVSAGSAGVGTSSASIGARAAGGKSAPATWVSVGIWSSIAIVATARRGSASTSACVVGTSGSRSTSGVVAVACALGAAGVGMARPSPEPGAEAGRGASVFWPARRVGMGCVSSAMMSCAEIADALGLCRWPLRDRLWLWRDLLWRLRLAAIWLDNLLCSCPEAGDLSGGFESERFDRGRVVVEDAVDEVQIDRDVCIRDFAARCRHLIEARVRHDVGFVGGSSRCWLRCLRPAVLRSARERSTGRAVLPSRWQAGRAGVETSWAAMSRPAATASASESRACGDARPDSVRLMPVEALTTAGAGALNFATGANMVLGFGRLGMRA